jgi:hypothetical protein
MKFAAQATFLVMTLLATDAIAEEEFGIEDAFAEPSNVPATIGSDIEKDMSEGAKACLTKAKTNASDALEAKAINLGQPIQTLVLKPKQPSAARAAWGCFCGANTCPMWIYSFDDTTAQRLLTMGGVSLEIIDHKDKGMKRLLMSSGSAAYQSATLYAWTGQRYAVLREKTFRFDERVEVDQAKKELADFRADAAK